MIKEMEETQYDEAIGWHAIFFLKGHQKFVARIISVDMENKVIEYKVESGPQKGKVRRGRLNPRPFKVYDDESLIKALMNK